MIADTEDFGVAVTVTLRKGRGNDNRHHRFEFNFAGLTKRSEVAGALAEVTAAIETLPRNSLVGWSAQCIMCTSLANPLCTWRWERSSQPRKLYP